MVSAYLISNDGEGTPPLDADLESVGIAVLGRGDVRSMVQEVLRTAPDLLVCFESHPDDALFEGTAALNRSAPRPTVVFTTDPDADKIERATRSGVHAYVVAGYAPGRLRSVIHVAQARFRYVEGLRGELADIHHRFSERKLIDQAKAILMRLRNLPEDDAYAALRTAAMKANRRMGQIARQIIDAARYGEAVNRAGQLRMTSQRLVKLYALGCAGIDRDAMVRLLDATVARVDDTLGKLGRTLSKPTFGDLLESVSGPWAELRRLLDGGVPSLAVLPAVDEAAERLLAQAEQLTTSLETAGFAAALRLINVSGRQRMLSQRLAKQALLGALLDGPVAQVNRVALAGTAEEYRAAMVYLAAVPLTTPAIAALFAEAAAAWATVEEAVPRAGTAPGQRALQAGSEALLAAFEALTEHYERSLQLLMQA